MQSATFFGEVQGGRLHIQQGLDDFEGKQVLVTVTATDAPPVQNANGATGTKSVALPAASSEAEILEDIGRIRLSPRAVKTLAAKVVSAGRRALRISVERD